MVKEILDKIDDLRDEMKNSLIDMLKIPAVGPDNNGDGEAERAEFLMDLIDDCGFDTVERYDAKDHRVSSGIRPNIVAVKKGEENRYVTIVAHMDIVPEGDLDLWETDPYDPVFKDGKIIGRGSEDNGQEVIAALYTAKALTEAGVRPKYSLKVILVSDEETGSEYGVRHLIKEGVVTEDDIVIVPDHSEEHGKKIEITEKSGLWVKITVKGKQGHGASPEDAVNSNRVMAIYQNHMDKVLHDKFDEEDPLFAPPISTFEPTRREKNVPNVNTIPGKEIQYFDCRVLPRTPLSDVKQEFQSAARDIGVKTGTTIDIEYVADKESPKGTPEDADVVMMLKDAIMKVTGSDAKPCGIGGGTVAAHFREKGIPAVVWATNEKVPHQPNEYALLDNMVTDCKVFVTLVTGA